MPSPSPAVPCAPPSTPRPKQSSLSSLPWCCLLMRQQPSCRQPKIVDWRGDPAGLRPATRFTLGRAGSLGPQPCRARAASIPGGGPPFGISRSLRAELAHSANGAAPAWGGCGLEGLEGGFGFLPAREAALFGAELGRVDAAAAAALAHGMAQVQHFVIEHVLEHELRHAGRIEDAADQDGVVGGIVVAEVAAGDGRGPAEVGASHPALEEAQVEVVKEGFEVVVAALGRLELLAAANLADEVGLGGDVLLTDEATVAGIVDLGDGAAVELAQQDVGKGLEHQFGGGLQEIAQADEEAAFAQADGVVEVGEGIEADLHGGEGRAGLE